MAYQLIGAPEEGKTIDDLVAEAMANGATSVEVSGGLVIATFDGNQACREALRSMQPREATIDDVLRARDTYLSKHENLVSDPPLMTPEDWKTVNTVGSQFAAPPKLYFGMDIFGMDIVTDPTIRPGEVHLVTSKEVVKIVNIKQPDPPTLAQIKAGATDCDGPIWRSWLRWAYEARIPKPVPSHVVTAIDDGLLSALDAAYEAGRRDGRNSDTASIMDELVIARDQWKKLEAWKTSAMDVMQPLQDIAKELGLPLGKSIPEDLAKLVRTQTEQIHRIKVELKIQTQNVDRMTKLAESRAPEIEGLIATAIERSQHITAIEAENAKLRSQNAELTLKYLTLGDKNEGLRAELSRLRGKPRSCARARKASAGFRSAVGGAAWDVAGGDGEAMSGLGQRAPQQPLNLAYLAVHIASANPVMRVERASWRAAGLMVVALVLGLAVLRWVG